MTRPVLRAIPPQHPLQDRDRLEDITTLMSNIIQKKLSGRRSNTEERTLRGGDSLEDILQTALLDLLRYSPPEEQALGDVQWERLAVRIAQRRAIDAIREDKKHRAKWHEPDDSARPETSGEFRAEQDPISVEDLRDPNAVDENDVVEALLEIERAQHFHRVAEAVLDERALDVVQRISAGETREEISSDYGRSGQRIGQIYKQALEELRVALKDDSEFQRLIDHHKGREMT